MLVDISLSCLLALIKSPSRLIFCPGISLHSTTRVCFQPKFINHWKPRQTCIQCSLVFPRSHLTLTVTNGRHFQKCIQFRILPQISKYYNHYEIGEFPVASSLYNTQYTHTVDIINKDNLSDFQLVILVKYFCLAVQHFVCVCTGLGWGLAQILFVFCGDKKNIYI